MATLVDPDFRARLDALGERYGATVPGAMEAISTAVSHCRNEDADLDSLEKLHALLHGIAGSAGTFGFKVLGAEARRLEQELRPLLGKRPADAPEWPALAARIAQYLDWAARDPKAPEFDL
ncbi:Hpt domain-containing protein [Pseudoduganella namucuonensis]|uniref:Hpt domain-containing protein n=1 Tax=Pseudoduganella namucuonensis TaxID=1035707 RepID=A0A1I7HLI5_9BURK|nr:Hpt domain-containing protein [Pseudoduganella namucuonensis]SFU61522.1 Hpt domain-containing protein [Pseudoduganella namucuonensis]